jgi:hypothetical protein
LDRVEQGAHGRGVDGIQKRDEALRHVCSGEGYRHGTAGEPT